MSVTLFFVAALSFLAYQAVVYINDVRSGDESKTLIWKKPSVLFAVLFLSAFTGIIVALVSQEQTVQPIANNQGEGIFPLNYDGRSIKEWLRAILLGYGAMPILKKGNLAGIKKLSVQNTPIKNRRPTFKQYIGAWWNTQ